MDLGQHEGGATISTPVPANFSPFQEAAAKLKLFVAGVSNANANGSGNSPVMEEGRPPLDAKVKKPIRYRECLKNHAASLGGYALDGCGEFMPSGEEGSLEALKCAACHCHRNFHRREVEGEHSCDCGRQERSHPSSILPPHTPLAISPSATFPRPPQMIMALNAIPSESDDHAGFPSPPPIMLKRRFRTKFTAEQKERMFSFAEQLGWRFHKQNEAAVEQFCSEVNVTRNVLKEGGFPACTGDNKSR